MKNNTYMCILRSESGGCEQPSPSEMEIMYAKYQAWQQKFSDNIVDMGNKLGATGSVVRHDSISDGPFIELKEIVGGYMTLTAETLAQAIAVIQASPMVANTGTSVEIREICRP
ncbi:MAG: YciI family protein [Thalassotalea sp.]